ncbi:MAG: PTS fructose transporter subunit IIA [Johnsonella sp.]|nr:PTS fructose transporter subunit IIA [Johnsonella sp.]
MYGVIITAHNQYASGVYSGLKLVCGGMENIAVVDFPESCGTEELDEKLREAYESLSAYSKIIFITDLLGGTPFNRSVMNYGEKENVRVLAGLNFPLLYTAVVTPDSEDMDRDIAGMIEAGREGIAMYRAQEKKENISEEGI